jgi:ubiquinone/menaquinone biosynthesis C-methylase UbiE
MDPRGPDAIRGVYRRNAAAFDTRRTRILFERAWLERFLALAPPGAPALSLGCGAGEPVERFLIEAGRPLVGVDFSPEMLALARGRFPRQAWIEADMRDLDLGRRFGGVLAWDSFFHLTASDQRAMFAVFARHLEPGGALLFTCGPGAGEAVGAVEADPVYHASLSPAEYAALMEAHGILPRRFTAEDPDCGGRSVWLGRAEGAAS